MRTMRPGVAWLVLAIVATLCVPRQAVAQGGGAIPGPALLEPYYPTIHFGTGLITTPVAWISPRSGAVFFSTSAKEIPSYGENEDPGFYTRWNTNLTIETQWWGRLAVGASLYSQNPDWGLFGRVALLRDGDFGMGWLPSLAVGVRNIGPCETEERFLIGCDIALDPTDSTYETITPDYFEGFDTRPTLYAVATKDFRLSGETGRLPGTSLGLNVGYGNGLFRDDGGLGDRYNLNGTIAEGLFLGARLALHPTLNTTLSLAVENDGWDWNAGIVGDWRGITVGLYGTELEEDSEPDAFGFRIYNYRKLNFTVGYAGNIYDIGRGVLLRTRITDLALEQQRLRYEIAERERRIRGLEVALARARAGELANIARRRQQLEQEIQAEREAIRRAEERLRDIQEGREPRRQRPPSTTPPSGTP